MILVSACLLGINCKYSGGNNRKESWIEALKGLPIVPICPEQLGGLTTPRPPAEITSTKPLVIKTKTGEDVTDAFCKGAEELCEMARIIGATVAILKAKSPSCGKNTIYDGSFSKTVIPGRGIAADALMRQGITVFSEDELDAFKAYWNEV